jgi:hypothetical protein
MCVENAQVPEAPCQEELDYKGGNVGQDEVGRNRPSLDEKESRISPMRDCILQASEL